MGLQPRRNCRHKSRNRSEENISCKTLKHVDSDTALVAKKSADWQSMFVDIEMCAEEQAMQAEHIGRVRKKMSATRAVRSSASSPALSPKLAQNPIRSIVGDVPIPPVCAGAIVRPRRKSTRQLTSNTNANEPMKTTPLDKQFYGKLLNFKTTEIDVIAREYTFEMDKDVQVIKAPPLLPNINTEQQCSSPRHLKRSRSFTLSSGGLQSDKYDPFLSAKRQLEELSSPVTPDATLPLNQTQNLPSTPSTPISITQLQSPSPKAMTTSLTLSTSTPNASQQSQLRNPVTKAACTSSINNNFRRTSSLRGPRRSPLLPTRPLFVHNYRPTIQRGLSDEGPISTNFLKPEEYDEMPVRSVCVNDFALTKSPRVVRRDLNATANRKQSLKLNLNVANPAATNETNERELTPLPGIDLKTLSKTDSLAVFLKYERELEQLTNHVEKEKETINEEPLDTTVISKELKDKSNTLSKQNSAKNLQLDVLEASRLCETNVSSLCSPSATPKTTETNSKGDVTDNVRRLVPLSQRNLSQTNSSEEKTIPQLPPVNIKPNTINLNSLFGNTTHLNHQLEPIKSATSTENIDPKLINKYDNLSLNLLSLRDGALKRSDDSEENLNLYNGLANSSSSQLDKLPSSQTIKQQQQQQQQQQEQCQSDETLKEQSVTSPTSSAYSNMSSQRSSVDGRNLLKRKMRLGRNQFLYDASPEERDDSIASKHNEGENSAASDYQEKPFLPPTNSMRPTIPPLPLLDDFDFEEFLSSFENDDEQLPLFRDCREFLMNRTSNKQRSTHTSHSNRNTNRPLLSNLSKALNQMTSPTHNIKNHEHFQFPQLITPSSFTASPLTPIFYEPHSGQGKYQATYAGVEESIDLKSNTSNDEPKKREIFISIETEQSDSGQSPISPASLRNMVGNPQTMIEVDEVSVGCDTKFSKISDDDYDSDRQNLSSADPSSYSKELQQNLPNVQLNNAKNLIQRMQDQFRQLNEETELHVRQAVMPPQRRNSSKQLLLGRLTNNNNNTHATSDAAEDSDELNSVEGCPISRPSRRGVMNKTSSDSAYGR